MFNGEMRKIYFPVRCTVYTHKTARENVHKIRSKFRKRQRRGKKRKSIKVGMISLWQRNYDSRLEIWMKIIHFFCSRLCLYLDIYEYCKNLESVARCHKTLAVKVPKVHWDWERGSKTFNGSFYYCKHFFPGRLNFRSMLKKKTILFCKHLFREKSSADSQDNSAAKYVLIPRMLWCLTHIFKLFFFCSFFSFPSMVHLTVN